MEKFTKNLLAVTILMVFIHFWAAEAAHIKMTVHYEAFCPHSRKFITRKLYPLYMSLGGAYNDWFDIEFYPYGKALTEWKDGRLTISCQHGRYECALGKLQACATRKVSHEMALAFINCTMTHILEAPKCGNDLLGKEFEKLKACGESMEGTVVMASNGVMVRNLDPPMIDVPRVTLYGHFTPHEYQAAQTDWIDLLCKKWTMLGVTLPPQCDGKKKL